MEILVSYKIWPRTGRILRIYCKHFLMVAWEGIYCGALFKG